MLGTRKTAEQTEERVPDEPEQGVHDRLVDVELSLTEEDRNEKPAEVCDEEHEQRTPEPRRDPILLFSEEGVRDVAAVELSERQEVDHRHEQARPTCERRRIQAHVAPVWD